MKKIINTLLAFTLVLGLNSCSKEADIAGFEAKLPAVQLSSLGYQQVGPFSSSTFLQLNFGASITNKSTGAFKIEILNGTSATSAVLTTVNFLTWSGKDTGTTPVHTISNTVVAGSYPNTKIYQGLINLKLSSLGLTSGSTYSIKAYAYSLDGVVSTITQTSFFKYL